MGNEYRLRFDCEDPSAVILNLSRLRAASSSDDQRELVFREANMRDSWPDATFRLEPSGAYFCDHGGNGQAILGLVISRLMSLVHRVTIEEYEP